MSIINQKLIQNRGGYILSPSSNELREELSKISRYNEEYKLYKETGEGIYIPRNYIKHDKVYQFKEFPVKYKCTMVARDKEQERVIQESTELLKNGDSFVLKSSTGSGKCHPKDTKIMMHSGEIKMVQDIEVGDLLMGPDSTPRKVLNTNKGYGKIYKIIPTKGESWECNEPHVFNLKRTNDGTKLAGKTINIPLNEYLQQNKHFKHVYKLWRTGVDFIEKDVFDPYIIGLYLSDGSKGVSVLHCGNKKREAIEYCRGILNFGAETFRKNCNRISVLNFNSIRKLLLNRKNERFIPNEYLINSKENRLMLLAGILDGDGYLGSNVFEVSCKDDLYAQQILFLCRSLGLAAYCKKCTKRIKSTGFQGEYNIISISGDLEIIPNKVTYKKAGPRLQKKSVLVTGFSVEYIRDDDYYGFSLDGDSLYLLHDTTVTHNTVMSLKIIENIGTRVLIIVPKKDIFDHWVREIVKFLGIPKNEIGIIKGNTCFVGEKITITTVQSISKTRRYSPATYDQFGLIVIDECHRLAADQFVNAMWQLPAKLRLGLSATPKRKDNKDNRIEYHIGPVMVESVNLPLIPHAAIINTQFCFHDRYPQSFNMLARMGNLLAKDVARNTLLIQTCIKCMKSGRQTMLLVATKTHLETLTDMFLDTKIDSNDIGFYVGGMKAEELEESKKKSLILGTLKMGGEGSDIPSLGALIMGTPLANIEQLIGRLTRRHETKCNANKPLPGKIVPLFFDIADNNSWVYKKMGASRKKVYKTLKAVISNSYR